jgi:glycosyltransferase involved in cell wall biosynthesis
MDLNNLRIDFLAGTLGQGGAERQLYYMLRALVSAGAKPRVLCFARGEFWENPIRDLGVPVLHVGRSRSRLRRLFHLFRALRRDPPRMLQSVLFYTNMYAALTARARGIREIGAIRSDVTNEVQWVGGYFGRHCLSLPRMLFANSRISLRRAEAAGVPATRLRFIPNVVDTDVFCPGAGRGSRPVRVIGVGRLTPEKRFDLFLEIIASLRREGVADLEAVIAGDGVSRDALERQAAELGLADRVRFLGNVADMPPLYQSADVLLLTSEIDGTPNVILEAMACGLPVVATNVGGVRAIVPEDCGSVLPSGDVGGLTAALRALLDSDGARMARGGNARHFIVEHHSIHQLTEVLRALYADVLSSDQY